MVVQGPPRSGDEVCLCCAGVVEGSFGNLALYLEHICIMMGIDEWILDMQRSIADRHEVTIPS